MERHEGAPGPQRCSVPAILLPASDEHLLSSLNRISYGGASAGTQSTRGRKVLPNCYRTKMQGHLNADTRR